MGKQSNMTCNNWHKREAKYIYSYDYSIQETLGGEFQPERLSYFMSREDVQNEIQRTASTIINLLKESKTNNKIYIPILTDTHFCENGNWEYTAKTLEAVINRIKELSEKEPDAIVHLGDFTDGLLSREICKEYSGRVLSIIKSLGYPLIIALGNHDANYFRNNKEILSDEEQYQMYLNDTIPNSQKKNYYRVDIKDKNCSCLILNAYDNNESDRYGYDDEQLEWLEHELDSISNKVMVYSHDAPMTKLDYWSSKIRNGERLCEILERHNEDNKIIAFVHGHTHAELISYDRTFPIISIPCNKLEYFEKYKPAGSYTSVRYEDEVSQEQWDTLIIDTDTNVINIVRFGAGYDRLVDKNNVHIPKIWAHRGASGYAPENTLEAFKLAIDMKADGIELDVQYTKDRKLVVIHDETINRTSGNFGEVVDYTLEELKKMNFNKTHPEYENSKIPTLEEVLELLAPTNLELNIELKTNVNFYPGIEKDTLELVKKYNMLDRVIYSSFNHDSIRRIKELEPLAKCGFLYSEGIIDVAGYCKKYEVEAAHPYYKAMRYPGFIEKCKEENIKLHPWTINEENEFEQMRQYGVDAIITNFPDRARKIYYGESIEYMPPVKENMKKKNPILHAMGITYKYVRRPFVMIDRIVQGAAKK